jgi:hypothetical protein
MMSLLPSDEDAKSGHCLHEASESAPTFVEYLPSLQVVQEIDALKAAYLPASQGRQEVALNSGA